MARPNLLVRELVRICFVVAVAVGVLSWAQVVRADNDVLWQMDCGIDHFAPDDPIVHPGQAGASHMHSFYGNTSTNASSSAATLMASPSSCGRNMETTDHSGYWIPSLYQKTANGSMQVVKNQDQNIFVYYNRAGGATGPKVQPFPLGLKMVAGDAAATSAQPKSVLIWDCGGGGPEYSYLPKCQANYSDSLHATIMFPNCWDGVHLDSADHKSHMAYSNADTGVCPADHPVSLPQLDYEISYPYNPGGPGYVLSSGSPYSMHGDFFAAWDSRVQNALVGACLNAGRDCIDVTRNGDILTAGDDHPVPAINLANYSASAQTLGDQTATVKSPASAPVAVAAATPAALPDTGPAGLVGAAVALGILGFVIYEYRFRRRSLKRALRDTDRER